jgi:hypothetical protein
VAFGDDDLNVMIADVFSVAVSYASGAQTCRGFLNRGDQIIAGADGSAFNIRTTTLDIQTGDLTSLTNGAAITADSVAFTITDIAFQDDGKNTRLTLSE